MSEKEIERLNLQLESIRIDLKCIRELIVVLIEGATIQFPEGKK